LPEVIRVMQAAANEYQQLALTISFMRFCQG